MPLPKNAELISACAQRQRMDVSPPGDPSLPVVGDWDDDGDDTIGLHDPATSNWYLRSANPSGRTVTAPPPSGRFAPEMLPPCSRTMPCARVSLAILPRRRVNWLSHGRSPRHERRRI